MSGQDRRTFIRQGIGLTALVSTGSLAGCSTESIPLVGNGSSVAQSVPESADSLVYADVDVILEDEGVRTLTNTYLDQQSEYEYYDGPTSLEEWISTVEDESNFDVTTIDRATVFAEFGGESYETYDPEYGAAIGAVEVTLEDLRESVEEGFDQSLSETEYNGQMVFEAEDEDFWVGSLPSEGGVAVGTEDGVKDAIDVAQGDEDAVASDLADAFSGTRDSPFRFASRVPDTGQDEPIPEETTRYDDGEEVTYDLTVFDDIELVSGSVYRDGTLRGMAVSFTADSSDTAGELAELLQEMQDEYASMWEGTDDDVANDIASILREVEISQDGATVTSSLEKEIEELDSLIEEYGGPSESGSAEETGQQSSDQVTNRLEVVSSVGTVETDAVTEVALTVSRAPGAGTIALDETTIQFVASSGSYDLIPSGSDSADATIATIQDDNSSIATAAELDDSSDRAEILVDLSSLGTELSEGSTATLRLNTQSGGTTEVRLVVPETLSGSEFVSL